MARVNGIVTQQRKAENWSLADQLLCTLDQFLKRWKKKNGSKLGCDVIYGSQTSTLQLLEKDLTFFKSVVYNTKTQEK